jgi:glycosyltransferase involved in cell wall biosynthesis
LETSLVSVIVPTYNRAYCLPRTLDSILGQTYPRFEVILIDDGSTDGTGDLVARTYGHDARIKYHYQQNQGVTAARNQALARVRGDYVAFLDSDDVWMPWKLELQLACFRKCPEVGMVWSDMQAIGSQGEIVSNAYLRTMYHAYRWFTMADLFPQCYPVFEPTLPPELASTRLHVGQIFSQMFMGNLVHTSTVMLNRQRFEKVRKFNEILRVSGEDYDFHFRTCREGPVGFLDVASIQYQTGLADRLTGSAYKVHASQNCLTTVLNALHGDRSRILLPRSMIRTRLAEVHEWLGASLLARTQKKRARKHLLKSLRYRPLQPRTLALLTRASLPDGIGKLLQRCWHRLKKTLFPLQGEPTQTATCPAATDKAGLFN